ncbi:MAG: hypothetical protein H7256_06390 [Bdellovibrio sp.]|nr:hypothetical protein [Bdellovibrio sp.]
MKKVIIGHRGVGKTSFLKRHQTYCKQLGIDAVHFDLDEQIELSEKQSIRNIFKDKGEAYFRELEESIFKKLTSENSSYVISLGAGFNLKRISNENEVLLLSRLTDKSGRIFLNRPRLNPDESPLEEYKQRYLERNEKFLDKATQLYSMPEGIEAENETEKKIVTGEFFIDDAFYTLTEKEISNLDYLKARYKVIELRTDLISLEKIVNVVQADCDKEWLISVRRNEKVPEFANARYDFDIELPHKPSFFAKNKRNIISCHTDQIDQALKQVQDIKDYHVKLSPAVESFDDLIKGYNWQQVDSRNRSFLPRSKNGKWMWYRQMAKYLQEINFIRNFTFLKDQPSKYQWLSLPLERPNRFAAVLGKPVLFSRSPEAHKSFFANKSTFFTAIEIDETELQKNYKWLKSVGLTYAAVTAPLKKVAYSISTESDDNSKKFESVNTLYLTGTKVISYNTDIFGFQNLMKEVTLRKDETVAVWGGGGTLHMMQSVLPDAIYMSSQTALQRDGTDVSDLKPSVLVWAAPRHADTQWPPVGWKPALVVDLNYVENSMGLEYAQKKNLNYISGLKMFQIQALEQKKFWNKVSETSFVI